MILVSMTLVVLPEAIPSVLQALGSTVGPTRAERGCVACNLYRDIEQDGRLSLIEGWSSSEDLQRHLRSEEYLRVLLAMDLSAEPPQIHFDEVASRAGMEFIAAARRVQSAIE